MRRFRLMYFVLWALLAQPALLPPKAIAHDPIPGSFVTGPVLVRPGNYDYGAAAIFENGRTSLYWTSGFIFGDHMHRSESSGVWGPWLPERVVFGPTASSMDFDGWQTADFSVVRTGPVMLGYYTAHPDLSSPWTHTSHIGVAWSWDNGITWHRVLSHPIVSPHRPLTTTTDGHYGAGQPVAIWKDGWVYLFFSDSTAPGSNPTNGGSVYCIRSTDGFFQSNVQELTATGFVPRNSTNNLVRTYSLADAYSVDVMFVPQVNQFVMAICGIPGTTSFRFFDGYLRPLPRHNLDVPGTPWTEGPGFLRSPAGYSLPHGSGAVDRMSLIWYFPTGQASPWSWDLNIAGVDIKFTP